MVGGRGLLPVAGRRWMHPPPREQAAAVQGPNLASLDPDSGKITRLFHPRRDRWEEHFRREGPRILGMTDVGRTTVFLLRFNNEMNLRLRSLLMELGEPLD